MDENLKNRLASGAITRADVLAILEWQLSLPAEQMDCALISECDLFLAPDGPRLGQAQEDALLSRLRACIASGEGDRLYDELDDVPDGEGDEDDAPADGAAPYGADDPYDLDDVVEPIEDEREAPEDDGSNPYGPDDPYDLDDVIEPIEGEREAPEDDGSNPYGPDDPYDLDDVIDEPENAPAAPSRRQAAQAAARRAHRRPARRVALIALLAALLLALAVGGAAYGYRRGVLNFTEDFGFARMVSQPGADQLVSGGTLAHLSLEHVDVDVLEAAYDGAELRVVYALTAHDGQLRLAEHTENGYVMPGSEEGDVHMCDSIIVNGQDAYFDDTWEMPGDEPGQMLYYLQTNLLSWGVDVSGAQTLQIGLPMLPKEDPDARGPWPTVDFAIPAAVPEGLLRDVQIKEARMGGHAVSIEEARISPINGSLVLRIEDMSPEESARINRYDQCEVYAADGSRLTDSHLLPGVDDYEDGDLLLGVAITPPEGDWPDEMILALEWDDYSPDWEVTLSLSPAKP